MNRLDNIDDRILDLKRLAERSCMSVRSLRDHLKDPEHVLPSFRVGGKVYIRWPEFIDWIEHFRVKPENLREKVDDAVSHFLGDA